MKETEVQCVRRDKSNSASCWWVDGGYAKASVKSIDKCGVKEAADECARSSICHLIIGADADCA